MALIVKMVRMDVIVLEGRGEVGEAKRGERGGRGFP